MVVGMHAAAYVDFYTSEIGSRLRFFLTAIAVPTFFLVDGYLVGGRPRRGVTYPRWVSQSARRLLLPWLLFSVIYLVARILAESQSLVPTLVLREISVPRILLLVWTSTIAAQMYFLPALFGARLVAPACLWWIRRSTTGGILLVLGYAVAYEFWFVDVYRGLLDLGGLDPLLHAFWGLQYVLVGMWLAQRNEAFLEKAPWVAVVGCIGVAIFYGLDLRPGFVASYCYLLGAFAAFAWVGGRAPGFAHLGRETMGIFLLHTPVVMQVAQVALARLPGLEGAAVEFSLLTTIVVVVSFLLTRLVGAVPHGRMLFGEQSRPPRLATGGGT